VPGRSAGHLRRVIGQCEEERAGGDSRLALELLEGATRGGNAQAARISSAMRSMVSWRGSTITTRSGGAARSHRSTAARISRPEWPLRNAALNARRTISSSPAPRRARRARPRGRRRRPAPQLTWPALSRIAVGGGHRVRVEAETPGEDAHGGQALAGSDGPAQDLELQLREQLVVKRHPSLR